MVCGEALSSLGFLLVSQGDYQPAHAYLTQSATIFDALGEQAGKAWSLFGLGEMAAAQNFGLEAEEHYLQALSIQRRLNDHDHAGNTLEALGRLAQQQGNDAHAWTLFQESLALRVKMGHRPALASVLEAFGVLAAAQGQAEWAVQLFGAVDGLLQKDNVFLNPVRQLEHDRLVATLCEQLGEISFSKAWTAGVEMEFEKMLESLQETPSKPHRIPDRAS